MNRNGAEVAVPGQIHQVVLNVAHAQVQNRSYLYGDLSLRAFYDLSRLVARFGTEIDWNAVEKRFASARLKSAYGYLLCGNPSMAGRDLTS